MFLSVSLSVQNPVKRIPDTHEITLQHGTKTVSAHVCSGTLVSGSGSACSRDLWGLYNLTHRQSQRCFKADVFPETNRKKSFNVAKLIDYEWISAVKQLYWRCASSFRVQSWFNSVQKRCQCCKVHQLRHKFNSAVIDNSVQILLSSDSVIAIDNITKQ